MAVKGERKNAKNVSNATFMTTWCQVVREKEEGKISGSGTDVVAELLNLSPNTVVQRSGSIRKKLKENPDGPQLPEMPKGASGQRVTADKLGAELAAILNPQAESNEGETVAEGETSENSENSEENAG